MTPPKSHMCICGECKGGPYRHVCKYQGRAADFEEALSDIEFHSQSVAGESWEDAYNEVVGIATDALAKIRENAA